MTAVECPHCHTTVKWVEEYVGKEAGCPKCQRRFTMPAAPQIGMDHAPGYNPTAEDGRATPPPEESKFAAWSRSQPQSQRLFSHSNITAMFFIVGSLAFALAMMGTLNGAMSGVVATRFFATVFCLFVLGYLGLICDKLDSLRK